MKILIYGDTQTNTGYATHVKGLLTGLNRAGTDVLAETPLQPFWDRNQNLNDELIKIIQKDGDKRTTTICVAQPPFWHLKLADRPEKFYGFLVFEGDKIPKNWVEHCLDPRINAIFVPSTHTYNAAVNSGIPKERLHIIPHGVDETLYVRKEPTGDLARLKEPQKCTFLFNKGWADGVNDRSGFDILVQAFNEEFGEQDQVRLIAHINTAYNNKRWNFGYEVMKLKLPKFRAPLVYVDTQFPTPKLPELYSVADFIVSASKAEAFNLTILEGMACECIPIVPRGGGEEDYTHDIGIHYKADEVIPASAGWLYEGINWKKPDKNDLRKALRLAYENWKNKQWLQLERDKAVDRSKAYTWTKTGEKILEALK